MSADTVALVLRCERDFRDAIGGILQIFFGRWCFVGVVDCLLVFCGVEGGRAVRQHVASNLGGRSSHHFSFWERNV